MIAGIQWDGFLSDLGLGYLGRGCVLYHEPLKFRNFALRIQTLREKEEMDGPKRNPLGSIGNSECGVNLSVQMRAWCTYSFLLH